MKFRIPLLLFALSISAFAKSEVIIETPTPIVLDGVLDEAIWQTASPIEVNYLGGKTGSKSTEPRMTARYTWDGRYLYLAYEIFDSNLIAQGTGTEQGSPKNRRSGAIHYHPDIQVDLVEFFISFGDKHFMWEIHHNALNQFNDLLCVVPDPTWPISQTTLAGPHGILFNDQEWIADDGEATVGMAVRLNPKTDGKPSTINDPRDIDTGYTAEIRLPWRSIGAPKSAAPDKNTDAPDWNMIGESVRLLAVVQNGDLEERYHHSSPTRSPGWFHKAQPEWPTYHFVSTSGVEIDRSVRQVVANADAQQSSTRDVDAAAKLGIQAAISSAAFLDEQKPIRSRDLFEIMILAGDYRRLNPEMLQIYQPEAYQLFCTPEGRARQKRLANGLAWAQWPDSLPEAMIRMAPVPLIEWLEAQASSATPDLAKLQQMARPLGWWLRSRNERQHVEDFRKAIAALTTNQVITADLSTTTAILKLAADANAAQTLHWVLNQLTSNEPERRLAAADALGRLAELSETIRQEALPPFLKAVAAELEPIVQNRLAATAEAWPKDSNVGAGMRDLFKRSSDAEVRRSILFAVANTQWPQADELISLALDDPQSGVIGAALEAAAVHPSPKLTPIILKLSAELSDAPPPFIDALGSSLDPAAGLRLLEWLEKEKNPALRLKLMIALSRLPGDAVAKALVDLLGRTVDPVQAETLCRIANQRELPGASSVLATLAEDATAPLSIRAQAVWALGHYRDPTARNSLKHLSKNPEEFFASPEKNPLLPEAVEQARVFIDLARLRQGETGLISQISKGYTDATPATRVAILQALAGAKMDHPLIREGLNSGDYAILQAAVQAAAVSGSNDYQAQLQKLKESPSLRRLADSGLDISPLTRALDQALQPPTKP